MREVPLPAPFRSLAGQVNYVQKKSSTEYTSSCPKCGATGHKGRDWPDRFIMFLDDAHPRAWCRRCGYFTWADQIDGKIDPPSHKELERWRKRQIKREEARQRSAERALRILRDKDICERYHIQTEERREAYWANRGVPVSWQGFWQLGYDPGHDFRDIVSDAASIPIFGYGRELQQIKYRLLNEDHGRYRYHLAGIPAPPFLCNPDERLTGDVIAVEGEIKSMVTFVTLDESSLQMVGLPGTNPGDSVIEALSDAASITLVMDPGTRREAWELVKALGRERCRVLICPAKIDDAILATDMTKREVRQLLNQAVPCG